MYFQSHNAIPIVRVCRVLFSKTNVLSHCVVQIITEHNGILLTSNKRFFTRPNKLCSFENIRMIDRNI